MIAIVTDSNSGITQKEAKELGIYVLPMPFMIEDEIYYEEKDLTQDAFYEKMAAGAKISTSQPTPEEVTGLWDRVLTAHESLVYIPMSSGLSGSCQTAQLLAQDPQLLILDEPTNHLDLVYQKEVFALVRDTAEECGGCPAPGAERGYERRADSGFSGTGRREFQHLYYAGYTDLSETGRQDYPCCGSPWQYSASEAGAADSG